MAGQATLDSIRAVLKSSRFSGISVKPKVALWGYSGGALATNWAVELQRSYAPELSFVGAAIGGLIGSIGNVLETINKGPFAGLAVTGLMGLYNEYPYFATYLEEQFIPATAETFKSVLRQCLGVSTSQFSGQDISSYFKSGAAVPDGAPAQKVFAALNLGQNVPKTPLYIYKSINDQISPIADTDNLVNYYCKGGATIEYKRDLVSDHTSLSITGAGEALVWLEARMSGQSPESGCSTDTVISTLLNPEGLALLGTTLVEFLIALLGVPVGPLSLGTLDSEEERAHFGADPDFFLRYRKAIEGYFNSGWKTFYKGSAAQAEAQAGTLAHCQEIFHDETLRNFMTPIFWFFPFGVTKMNEDGIVHLDGTVNKYDAIVCATGFDTSFTPRFPIHGRNGHELMEDFSKSPEAYLGLAVHGYPNFFMFSGPISPVGNGSAFPGAEGTAEYIAQFLKKFYKERIRTFEIKQKPQDDFNDWVQAKMSKMVWTDNCDSWYKHPKTGKVQVTWPGSMLHYREVMADVHYEHFKLDYLSKNVFDWFGNGLTWSEVNDKHGDMAPYIT
ncbi:hypothetical protein V502_04312 [Pseudogymnoascus sp. VKM F-4520 (FW-2644)]|nr:hypothetical protein V502_04312 [Pseudogymnoascus sp. VKM F-4520 (FW-2644)]